MTTIINFKNFFTCTIPLCIFEHSATMLALSVCLVVEHAGVELQDNHATEHVYNLQNVK